MTTRSPISARRSTLEPEHHLAYQRRGEVYTELGLLDRAIIDLERAVMLSPGDSEVVLALNRAIEQRDQVAGTLGDDATPVFSPPEIVAAAPTDSTAATAADATAPPPTATADSGSDVATTAVAEEAPQPASQVRPRRRRPRSLRPSRMSQSRQRHQSPSRLPGRRRQ